MTSIPDVLIAVLTDTPGPLGDHTDNLSTKKAPPLPVPKVEVKDAGQSGKPVFCYGKKVAVKGGTGKSEMQPHCPKVGTPEGTFEITHGMDTVLTTGIPTAFLVQGQIIHCEKTAEVGPGPNFLIAGGSNKQKVHIGGTGVLGRKVLYKGFSMLSASRQAALSGAPGGVEPAPTDGSDAGVNAGTGGPADGAGTGGAAENPTLTDPRVDENGQCWFPYKAIVLIRDVNYAPLPSVQFRISGNGASFTQTFDAAEKEGEVGPFPAGTSSVSIELVNGDDELSLEIGDTSTYETAGGGGSSTPPAA